MTSEHTAGPEDRFNWLERSGDDFPYYNGRPVLISGGQWWFVMLAVAAGFALLIYPLPFLRGTFTKLVPPILYWAVPLAALAMVAGTHWKALFRKLRGMDFVWMLVFFVLNFLITLVTGSIIVAFFEHTANPVSDSMVVASTMGKVLFFVRTGIQLFGEEVFSILPFLALLYWLNARLRVSRKKAIVLAAIGVAVIFAAVHLPTYQWHLPQALIGVGIARLVLLLPYIMTKNIWVSTGAHILNDWAIFGLPLLASGAAS